MKIELIHINKDEPSVTLTAYYDESYSDAILVIPGGGYGRVCSDREGEPVAKAFFERGVNAFVLNYRVAPNRYPAPLIDAALAMKHIRDNKDKYNINPERIFVVGFSAGGHLAGLISTKWRVAETLLSLPEDSCRPDGTIYGYAVVSAYHQPHCASFSNLTGMQYDELNDGCRDELSIELNVNDKTPPAFIFHTAEDEIVNPLGSLVLSMRYLSAKIPFTLHIYPYGPHGISLSNEITAVGNDGWVQPLAESWIEDSVRFFKTIK